MNAARSIDDYLKQLRAALAGQDPALIQDALYDAEEYLRAEVAVHPGKSEADVLELIASTYGAPDEVAAAYRDTEAKVRAALQTPVPAASTSRSPLKRFFGVYLDPRSYTALFYMLLALATGVLYFTFVVTGLALSAGFAILIIGIPFFLAFVGIARVIALGEGRLLEGISGARMPRRPVHPGPAAGWWTRIGEMLKDIRTWTTLAYLLVMLPLGIIYFTIAATGLSVSAGFIGMPLVLLTQRLGWTHFEFANEVTVAGVPAIPDSLPADHPVFASVLLFVAGVIILTTLMHLARALIRGHVGLAKALLVVPGA